MINLCFPTIGGFPPSPMWLFKHKMNSNAFILQFKCLIISTTTSSKVLKRNRDYFLCPL
jgi:hypothetical protein